MTRYARHSNAYLRTGAVTGGVFVFLNVCGYGINFILRDKIADNATGWGPFAADFSDWATNAGISYNVDAIINIVLLAVAVIFLAVGWILRKKE